MSQPPVVDIEQAQVTPDTKFRRGGFRPAAEVIAETEAATAAGEVPAAEEPADPVMAAAIEADVANSFVIAGEGVVFEEPETPTAEEPAEMTAEPTKFKIKGREFASQAEAWAYAEQLEEEKIAADAFRQGVELGAQSRQGNPAPEPSAPAAPREIDPLYYTDPAAYHAKLEAEIIAKADAHITRKQQQAKTHEETWNQFYSDYPDLASAREFVDMTLQQNWNTLQHVETKQALKQLAEKTRAKLKPIIEARMPKTELPKVKTAASPGGQQQVTQAKPKQQVLSLTQQMKNLKKNKAQLR